MSISIGQLERIFKAGNEEEGRGRVLARLSIVRRPYFETRVRVDVLIIRIRVLLDRELTRLQGRGKFEFFIFN